MVKTMFLAVGVFFYADNPADLKMWELSPDPFFSLKQCKGFIIGDALDNVIKEVNDAAMNNKELPKIGWKGDFVVFEGEDFQYLMEGNLFNSEDEIQVRGNVKGRTMVSKLKCIKTNNYSIK